MKKSSAWVKIGQKALKDLSLGKMSASLNGSIFKIISLFLVAEDTYINYT